jgi:hypothetical protein
MIGAVSCQTLRRCQQSHLATNANWLIQTYREEGEKGEEDAIGQTLQIIEHKRLDEAFKADTTWKQLKRP